MKIYLADASEMSAGQGMDQTRARSPFRFLGSYYFYKEYTIAWLKDYWKRDDVDYFVDSGAYSAFVAGTTVSVREYADYLQAPGVAGLMTVYANLDVKGDVDAGLKNQRYLEDRGLHPLPVFHGGEPLSVLRDLVAEYPYIALGGIAGSRTPRDDTIRWLRQCFEIAGSDAVFHGFGMTTWSILKLFPFYSVDSSTWTAGFRFGIVPLFDAYAGRFHMLGLGKPADWAPYAKQVRAYGYETGDFADRRRNTRLKIAGMAAKSYQQAEAYLTRRQGVVTIPERGRFVA